MGSLYSKFEFQICEFVGFKESHHLKLFNSNRSNDFRENLGLIKRRKVVRELPDLPLDNLTVSTSRCDLRVHLFDLVNESLECDLKRREELRFSN